jgi:type IV secretory pathway VirB2 component (pilin)
MIDNNALGDRLKDFKNKQDSSKSTPSQNPGATIIDSILTIFAGIMSVAKVFVFGYAAKLVFHTDWNLLGLVCIGLSINFLLTYVHDLIHPDNKVIKL